MGKRVAVIGASLPGLIIADACLSIGYETRIFGPSGQSGTEHSVGSMMLWNTEDVRRFIFNRCGEITLEVGEKRIEWFPGLKPDLEGYASKRRDKEVKEVCRGEKKISYIKDGFRHLRNGLLSREGLRNAWIPISVKSILRGTSGLVVIDTEGVVHGSFDVIVNTAPKYVYHLLRGGSFEHSGADKIKKSIIYQMHKPPGPESDDEVIYYCGDADYPWYRASFAGARSGWTYEMPDDPNVEKWSDYRFKDNISKRKIPSRIIGNCENTNIADFGRKNVIHVGRFAEGVSDMMVSDVIEQLDSYLYMIGDANVQ